MPARTGWRHGTMENAFMRGFGKAIAAGVIMIIIGTETVTAIMIVMAATNKFGNPNSR